MECEDCEYEPVCNALLQAQAKLGIVKCKQGRHKRVPKVKNEPTSDSTVEKV